MWTAKNTQEQTASRCLQRQRVSSPLCCSFDRHLPPRRLMKSCEKFHRDTLVVPELQAREDQRLEARGRKLKEQLIPRKVWQRCTSLPLPKVEKCYAKTWRDNNPEYEHTLLGDVDALEFVEEAYPTLKRAYLSLRHAPPLEISNLPSPCHALPSPPPL